MKIALILLPMLLVLAAAYQDDSEKVLDSVKDLGKDIVQDLETVIDAGQKALSDGLSQLEDSIVSHFEDKDNDEDEDCSGALQKHLDKHPLLKFSYYVLRYIIANIFYKG